MTTNQKLAVAATAILSATTATNGQESRPNVVLILIDDMGQRDLGCYGSQFYQTPNIDQLAEEGIQFENGYAACTVSSPSRAALMTGKYPARLHLTDWIEGHKYPYAKLNVPDWMMYLDPEEQTIAEQLHTLDYQTWHVGKWHLGEQEKDWAENHGFDLNLGGWAKGSPYKNDKLGYKGYFPPYGNPRLEDGEAGEYLTDRLTDEAVSLIEQRDKAKPFFLNLSHYAVHTPLGAKEEMIEKYKGLLDPNYFQKNTTYAAMVESVDESVGRVVEALKNEGIYDNTLIIFTSDNGALANISPALPLRLGKGERYEGGIRVPFIVRYGDRYASTKSDQPLISMDITTTIESLVGIKGGNTDGKDIFGLLRKGDYDRPLFWHYPHYHAQGAIPYSAIRAGDWKLIENFEDGSLELYNLKDDIGESRNLVDSESKIALRLHKQLQKWRESIDAQYPTPNPDYDPKKAHKK
ncbi:MAG: sulfatase [Rikenellaceae bacterium]